jgi:2-oxo-4-hydroxy-4-carboxy-5-ureidoimidazoline decarboxylase
MPYSLDELNQMDQAAFTAALGGVFEDSPAIAAQAWCHRPFPTLTALHRCLVTVMYEGSPVDQLALMQAHPDLGSRVAMTDVSAQEQTQAGLTQLTPREYDRFQTLNRDYRAKFGFPFILAVAGRSSAHILDAFERRLHNSPEVEHQQALAEIAQIAWIRLTTWIQVMPEP